MGQVLITIYKGIIDQVVFFDDPKGAIEALSRYVETMNPEHNEAALYDPEGMIANAKHFLDENDVFSENPELIEDVSRERTKSIYLICNPEHRLGFMVASPDDPLGYDDAVAALSDLGQMRKDFGRHLKLYRVIPANALLAKRDELEKYNADSGVEDFDYGLVEEYLI